MNSTHKRKQWQMRGKDSKFYSYAHKEKAFFFKMIHQQLLFATLLPRFLYYLS